MDFMKRNYHLALRAFSPYHQGPILGPIPNPKYHPFFQISKKKKSQSEGKKNLTGKPAQSITLWAALWLTSTAFDGTLGCLLCTIYTEMSSVYLWLRCHTIVNFILKNSKVQQFFLQFKPGAFSQNGWKRRWLYTVCNSSDCCTSH